MQIKLFFSFLLMSSVGFAQINVAYYENNAFKKHLKLKDSLSFADYVRKKQLSCIADGYFFAGLDSLVAPSSSGDSVSLYFHKGTQFQKSIYINNKRQKKPHKFMLNSLEKLTNNGYPFAQVRLDSFKLSGEKISAKMQLDKGTFIRYDSISFTQPIKTSKKYIEKLLGILPEKPFDENSFRIISEKLEEVPFLSLVDKPIVFFKDEKAYVHLNILEKPASSFEGIIGVQPNGDKTTIIGALDFSTQNLFRSGNKLKFHWEKYATASQELKLNYQHAFLFETNLFPVFDFQILKQDSTFLSQSLSIGFGFNLLPKTRMILQYQDENGSILARDSKIILSEKLLDYHKSVYSFTLSSKKLQNNNTVKNGFYWSLNSGVGSRTITRNSVLPKNYYDSLNTESNFFKSDIRMEANLKIGKNVVFNQRFSSGWISNKNLARNELYRLGGLKTLRGFNEKAFYTDFYLLNNAELRLFFEEKSFFYLFYDQSVIHQGVLGYPLGTGIGLSLESSAGQFNFAIAMGKSGSQSFGFSGVKVHFGYVSTF